jgi:hypothetical protein
MSERTCSIAGCDRAIEARGWCKAHYSRWLRSHSISEQPIRTPNAERRECEVDGCDRTGRLKRGMCGLHYKRFQRRGDPLVGGPTPRPYGTRGGGRKPSSDGSVGYSGIHSRVVRERGPASGHACWSCGQPAEHWAYDHEDPDARIDARDGAYSQSIDHYYPMCQKCHVRFDAYPGMSRANFAKYRL